MKADTQFFFLYFLASCTSFISLITSLLAWLYWQWTLNTCKTSSLDINNINCGCILYGSWGEFFFKGSKLVYCQFVSLAPIPVLLWSAILTVYHGYRAFCCPEKLNVTLIYKNRVDSVNRQTWPKKLMILYAIISSLIFALMFSTAVVISDGYLYTCKQYKKTVVKELGANGLLARAIYERMSCETMYDFMDYTQPDPEFLEDRYRRGSWLIDTHTTLNMAILGMWSTTCIYFVITICNILCSRIPIRQRILNTDL